MIRRLYVFGAAGDLTPRYLLPALARLRQAGALPEGFTLTGIAREDWDGEAFRRHIAARLAQLAPDLSVRESQALLAMLSYCRADVTDARAVREALSDPAEPVLVYFALPPQIYAPALAALARAGLPVGSRLMIEKPFGRDLDSARALNKFIAEHFGEAAVFRIDHFLGMQTVRNMLGLRFANRIVESLWSRDHIERVEIVWDETLALEGRAGYYDTTGALLDMVQNHLLQLLCLVAMEAPLLLNARDLRDRKRDVLRAVRRLSPEEVEHHTLRGRYDAGRIGDRAVQAYVDEPGVDAARGTETFAQVTLFIDNWRWKDVPIVLRTGKALARDRREINVRFRGVPHLAFEDSVAAPNVLHLQLDPDRMSLSLNVVDTGEAFRLEPAVLATDLGRPPLPAYGRLLLDALRGNMTLAIGADEAEAAWEIVEPIARAWSAGQSPLRSYAAGSAGPELR